MLPDMKTTLPGPRSCELAARLSAVESPAVGARRDARSLVSGASHAPIFYERGRASNVYDVDGNRYVDFAAGFGGLLLGYPPNAATTASIAAMTELPLALGDVYASESKVRACEAIAALYPEPGARVMLGLSGADAVSCALKTVALATKKTRVVAFAGSYHGLSHGPLAALGFAPSFREPFSAQLGNFVTFAPYPSSVSHLDDSIEAVRSAFAHGDVGAVLVEPILGRGGCVVPPSGFLGALRTMCNDDGALLVADEVWSGVGRTGTMFAFEHEGITPDIVCLGKGLGGGIAVSACLGRAEVMAAWGAYGGATIHTGTHFGSPPACAAVLATIAAARDLAPRTIELGHRFRAKLEMACANALAHASVRGRGLMVGVELMNAQFALRVSRALLERGFIVLTGGVGGNVLTLSPPLTISPEQLDAFAAALGDVLASSRP